MKMIFVEFTTQNRNMKLGRFFTFAETEGEV